MDALQNQDVWCYKDYVFIAYSHVSKYNKNNIILLEYSQGGINYQGGVKKKLILTPSIY